MGPMRTNDPHIEPSASLDYAPRYVSRRFSAFRGQVLLF